jgi:hypothetical protein
MSVQYKQIQETRSVVTTITCSRCKMVIEPTDFIQWQELQSIGFTGGYGSVFGDGVSVSVDLCQQCLYDLIGDFVEYDETQFNEE